MVDLALLSPEPPISSPAGCPPSLITKLDGSSVSVIARSRRAAILKYTSRIVDTAHRLSGLPWYILGWKQESEMVELIMFEGLQFTKGWKNVPNMLQVVVEADERMQFYEVAVRIRARLRGLR